MYVFSGLEIKLTLPFIYIYICLTKTAKIDTFETPLIRGARAPIHITIYKITRPISLSRLSITSWPSSCIDGSDKPSSRRLIMRRRTRAWYTACKPCAQPSEATRHFEVDLRQHCYGGSYKAKCFPWCIGGTNKSSTYFWVYRFSLLSKRSSLQSSEMHAALSLIRTKLQTLAWDAALIKAN